MIIGIRFIWKRITIAKFTFIDFEYYYIMIQPRRKSSEYTCNSPYSTDKSQKFKIYALDQSQSRMTKKSKYSNNSKLTKSQIFETLSKGPKNKHKETMKDRDT